ncbi:uncharacterized protein [Medicago truncatula]|uniref:uncharacterized protein isoform X2 n=1 Tax=Medicago truncatula TaxID=3880 RepID=UPI000D2F44A8|nr:uncharacterized protein LOC11442614 isoform X2 [Medicago truncatula]
MEAPMARLPPIQRTSSIEREPRTLDIGQIQSARNLAIYILNTKTFEEASRIFTEPVVSAASSMGSGNMDLGEELELIPQEAFRDIASAPF